jgi:hypothetical protein
MRILFLFLTLSILCLTSCTPVRLYQGEARPRSEVAVISFSSVDSSILAVSVDGLATPHPGRAVEVLPGPHSLTLKYQQHFEDSNETVSSNDVFPDERSGFGLVEVGTCTLRFEAKRGQGLFVRALPASNPLFGRATPPVIEMQEHGFFTPVLFQAVCSTSGQRPIVKW